MADNRTRFTSRQVTALKKSGALGFVAGMAGVKADELKVSSSGKIGAFTVAAVRRTAATNLAKLSDKAYNAAVETGFVKVLGQAWGISEKRLTSLRTNLYPDQRTGMKAQAPDAPERKPRAKGKRSGKTTTRKVSKAELEASEKSPEEKRREREQELVERGK